MAGLQGTRKTGRWQRWKSAVGPEGFSEMPPVASIDSVSSLPLVMVRRSSDRVTSGPARLGRTVIMASPPCLASGWHVRGWLGRRGNSSPPRQRPGTSARGHEHQKRDHHHQRDGVVSRHLGLRRNPSRARPCPNRPVFLVIQGVLGGTRREQRSPSRASSIAGRRVRRRPGRPWLTPPLQQAAVLGGRDWLVAAVARIRSLRLYGCYRSGIIPRSFRGGFEAAAERETLERPREGLWDSDRQVESDKSPQDTLSCGKISAFLGRKRR
jgi:hypothetical protein